MFSEQAIEGIPRGYSLATHRRLLQLNQVAAWPERIVLTPWAGRIPIDRPIFVVGPFRSGTTALEQILSSHPTVGVFWFYTNVAYLAPVVGYYFLHLLSRLGLVDMQPQPYLHNPRLAFTPLSAFECEWVWSQAGKDLWDPHCTDLTTGADFLNPEFERMLRSIIQRHLLVQGRRRFLNKNPIHLLRLEYLHKLFPDARFVYIVRDPVETVLSHYRMVQRIAAIIQPHPQARLAVESGLHLDVLTPRIKTQQYAETLALEQIHPLLGIAHQWRMMNLTAQASLRTNQALGRQVLQITYEALSRDPATVLAQVWQFVELEDTAAAAITTHAAGQLTPAPRARPTVEEARWLQAVQEIVAPAAAYFGYAGKIG
ncbi:MAG: sulfotransferase [Anaerolineales bacterium]|nr:sulfotransferase [Anaerolineales bacterium]